MNKENNRIWTKFFILLMIAAFFTTLCDNMMDSTLVLYATDTWNSKKTGGLLTSFFTAGSIIMAFFSRKLVDSYGRRKCFLSAAALFIISAILMALFPYRAVALSARFFQGCAKGLAMVASASMVADIIPAERLGEGMGYYGIAQSLPGALGPVIALAAISGGNYMLLFLLCASTYLFAGTAVNFVNYEKNSSNNRKERLAAAQETASSNEPGTTLRGIWKLIEKKAMIPSVIFTIFLFSTVVVLIFLTDYARDVLRIPNDRIAYFFTFSTIAGILMRMFCGRISDRFGALPVLLPSYLLHILGLFLLMYYASDSYFLFLLAGVFYGIGNAVVIPVLNSVAVVDSPKGRASAANAAFYFLMDVGILAAATIIGVVLDSASSMHAGYKISYAISILGCVIALILSLLFLNNSSREKRKVS